MKNKYCPDFPKLPRWITGIGYSFSVPLKKLTCSRYWSVVKKCLSVVIYILASSENRFKILNVLIRESVYSIRSLETLTQKDSHSASFFYEIALFATFLETTSSKISKITPCWVLICTKHTKVNWHVFWFSSFLHCFDFFS